jgi:RHS repeat-associated protein
VTLSLTAYDADGHPVASILPGGAAGDSPMVTRTAYDALGRPTDITVNAVAKAGETDPDVNLRTHTVFDALDRTTDVTNPKSQTSHSAYDRLGRVLSGTTDYGTGHLNLTALSAYDAVGEVLATCGPKAVESGCSSSNITNDTQTLAWHYAYDKAGHQTSSIPPLNTVATPLASTTSSYELGGAGRLHETVTGPRAATYSYDSIGHLTGTTVTTTDIGTLTSATTYDGAGRATRVSTSGTSSDTLDQAYDALDRLSTISRGETAITSFTYNPDGTAASRTDRDPTGATHANSFTYTTLGQLANVTLPGGSGTGCGEGHACFTWRLDGSLATRTWGAYVSGTYSYDRAKRPTGLAIAFGANGAGTIGRTYDRVGNAETETQTLTGVDTASDLAGDSVQTFRYDDANRLTESYFGPEDAKVMPRIYTYDADSNRTGVTESGVSFTYVFDTTDELVSKTQTDQTSNTATFAYDSLGQMSANAAGGPDSSVIVPTAYGYDPAGHLVCIGATEACAPEDTTAVTFDIDALGRHASRTVASSGVTETYAYLGTANTVSSVYDGTTLTFSAIDAIGDRLTSGTSDASAYLLPDLHGNVVATISAGATPTYVGAYRYDAYGETCDTYAPASGAVDSPWRYQGRIRESADGSPDLYDFSARSYSPGLGAFTSLDSVIGSAQNPLTLNRFLYAGANPATMIDPSGHCSFSPSDPDSANKCKDEDAAKPPSTTGCSPSTSDEAKACNASGPSTKPKHAPWHHNADFAPPSLEDWLDMDSHERDYWMDEFMADLENWLGWGDNEATVVAGLIIHYWNNEVRNQERDDDQVVIAGGINFIVGSKTWDSVNRTFNSHNPLDMAGWDFFAMELRYQGYGRSADAPGAAVDLIIPGSGMTTSMCRNGVCAEADQISSATRESEALDKIASGNSSVAPPQLVALGGVLLLLKPGQATKLAAMMGYTKSNGAPDVEGMKKDVFGLTRGTSKFDLYRDSETGMIKLAPKYNAGAQAEGLGDPLSGTKWENGEFVPIEAGGGGGFTWENDPE